MQAIDRITRTAATEDDGIDHIGYETPRSGIATPQPDLQDKRLPGIMSFYGQVRPDSFTTDVDVSRCPSSKQEAALNEKHMSRTSSAISIPQVSVRSSVLSSTSS